MLALFALNAEVNGAMPISMIASIAANYSNATESNQSVTIVLVTQLVEITEMSLRQREVGLF